ncbi:glycosyltransferase [Dermatophilus congolensis]|uniref:glycosyltransferase n=1 Tax=Dermatophilus congolensis TaxID=1863 RepID=UPI001AAF101C|nr:glycosyltransferase [Dermatophilus congolensis]MBO3130020.1 glycosyltransferase [Dermatophilus congolensis]MBO3131350.1 glycosyltransferase [Dermatophilus congolensis]MBO3134494.1 glycosyltransferase [Dermatophilus congolensis]MBO3136729.1 glycosyltransferase [Dermatophilus congolensis]MBO3138974.1 glycosyltransferase [Dermatophilus congolensis]
MTTKRSLRLDVIAVVQPGETIDQVNSFVKHIRDWFAEQCDTIYVYYAGEEWKAISSQGWQNVQIIRGFWDNDLGRARLDALNATTSDWAIILDINERLSGDPKKILKILENPLYGSEDYASVPLKVNKKKYYYGRLVRPQNAHADGSIWETIDTGFAPERSFIDIPESALQVTSTSSKFPLPEEKISRRLGRLKKDTDLSKGNDRQISYEIAQELQKLGDIDAAYQEYKKVAIGEDNWAWAAREAWADLLTSQKRLEDAASLLEQLEPGPNPEFATWLRAKWCIASGKTSQALDLMQHLECPTPTLGTPFPEDAVLRARLRLACHTGRKHDELTSRLALFIAGIEIHGAGKKLLKLWGKRRPEELGEVILEARSNHLEAIADEFDRSPYPGNLVARTIREHRQRYSVAAVIIARDEARCIQRCINSIKPFVDEVLVADTGSEDNTAELAEAAGARVIHIPWTDNFSEAHNTALDAAGADWHVIIDADEVIAAGGRELYDLHDLSPEFVLTVNVVSSFRLGETITTQSEPQSRILPGTVRYRGIIHATPQHDLPLRQVRITIEHDGYEPEQLAKKLPRREKMLRAAIAAEPDDPYLRYQLGRNLETQGRLPEAAEQYDKIDRKTLPPEPWQHILIVQCAHTLTSINRSLDALTLLGEYTDEFDHSSDYHFVAGNVLLDLATQQPELAAELLPQSAAEFRRALEIGEPTDLFGHVNGRGSYLAACNLEIVEQGCRDLGIALPDHAYTPSTTKTLQRGDAEDLAPLPNGSLDVVMIVKNEEAHLAQTLESCESLRPLLGEICVYDTGSTDTTRDIARAHGAKVAEGFWDNNYSRARNAAAAMSSAPWLLVLDADERVFANPTRLAHELAVAEAANDVALYIEAAPTSAPGERMQGNEYWMSPRIYRPDLAHYARPVHAELRGLDGHRFNESTELAPGTIRIENDGFGASRTKNSVQRALSLTKVAKASRSDTADQMAALVDQARAQWGAGDPDNARKSLHAAIALDPSTTYYRWAYQWLIRIELETENIDAAARELDVLKGFAPTDSYTRWLEAHLKLAQGQTSEALHIVQSLDHVVDAAGLPLSREVVAEAQLAAARQTDDALAIARALLRLGKARNDQELVHKASAALRNA